MVVSRQCRFLLNCKADINSRTDIDRTPLHEAGGENTGANGLTAVRFMLEHGANANARMQSCQGTTPLYLASKYWEVVDSLLDPVNSDYLIIDCIGK